MRAGFLALDASRHQTAIAGRIADATTKQPLAGASVTLSSVPAAFQARLAVLASSLGPKWDTMPERPDRTLTTFDGAFRFVDLTPGSYGLTVNVPGGKYQSATATAVVVLSGAGQLVLKIVNFQVVRAS